MQSPSYCVLLCHTDQEFFQMMSGLTAGTASAMAAICFEWWAMPCWNFLSSRLRERKVQRASRTLTSKRVASLNWMDPSQQLAAEMRLVPWSVLIVISIADCFALGIAGPVWYEAKPVSKRSAFKRGALQATPSFSWVKRILLTSDPVNPVIYLPEGSEWKHIVIFVDISLPLLRVMFLSFVIRFGHLGCRFSVIYAVVCCYLGCHFFVISRSCGDSIRTCRT